MDIERLRADTPGCTRAIHFNNAGAALQPKPVLDVVLGHLTLEAEIGGYEAADRAAKAIEHTYDALGQLLNCGRDEVALIENATRAWDMAFYALPPFAPGDRILTCMAEYASNVLAFLQVARRTGAVVEAIPDDEDGQISIPALRARIDERVRLIALTHIPTNGGLINPAAEVGRVAQEAGIPFLLDACQSAGQVELDVEAIGCDMLSATGRKYLRGPRGTGFLYVRRGLLDLLEPPMVDLHAANWVAADRFELRADARRFENWESFVAGRIGLGVAIDYALDLGLPAIRTRITTLAGELRARLGRIPGVEVRDLGREKSGIVTFTHTHHPATTVVERLKAEGFNLTSSGRSSTRFDMERRALDAVVRASVHYYNTEDEVSRFCAAVAAL